MTGYSVARRPTDRSWLLVHSQHGTVRTARDLADALVQFVTAVREEPSWSGHLSLEPFDLADADGSGSRRPYDVVANREPGTTVGPRDEE